MDFGIAAAAYGSSLTATGSMLGTAAYMSPERVSGEAATPGLRRLLAFRRRVRGADRDATIRPGDTGGDGRRTRAHGAGARPDARPRRAGPAGRCGRARVGEGPCRPPRVGGSVRRPAPFRRGDRRRCVVCGGAHAAAPGASHGPAHHASDAAADGATRRAADRAAHGTTAPSPPEPRHPDRRRDRGAPGVGADRGPGWRRDSDSARRAVVGPRVAVPFRRGARGRSRIRHRHEREGRHERFERPGDHGVLGRPRRHPARHAGERGREDGSWAGDHAGPGRPESRSSCQTPTGTDPGKKHGHGDENGNGHEKPVTAGTERATDSRAPVRT